MNREPERLQVLANLAACNDTAVAELAYIIKQIGFPKDNKSFRTYHCEEKFIEPPEGEMLHSYGRGSYRYGKPDAPTEVTPSDTTTIKDSSDSVQNADHLLMENGFSQQDIAKTENETDNLINPEKTVKTTDSVHNCIPEETTESRKQNLQPQHVFLYSPSRHSGPSYRTDVTGFAVTMIYGNDEELTAFLRTLSYTTQKPDAAALPPKDWYPVEYRIELGIGRVTSIDGIAELNEEQVDIISWFINDIDIKSPLPNPSPNEDNK